MIQKKRLSCHAVPVWQLLRLNRQEYANTVGDLFRLDPNFVEKLKRELPADGKAEGFDRIGSALFVDQTQMLGYLDWAGQIAREAVQSAPPRAETYVYEAEKSLNKNEGPTLEVAPTFGHQIPLGPTFYDKQATGIEMWAGHGGKPDEDKAWAMVPHGPRPDVTKLVTQDGYYRVRVHAGASTGARGTPVVMRLTYASNTPLESVHDITIQGTLEKPGVAEVLLFLRAGQPDQQKPLVPTWNGINNLRVGNPEWNALHLRWLQVQGKIQKAVAARDDKEAARLKADREQVIKDLNAFTGPRWIPHPTHDPATALRLFLDKIEVEGPLPKEWPPASHTALGLEDKTPQEENGLRTVFARLLPRAYRRPVENEEVEKLVAVAGAAMRREQLPFEEALRLGLQTMLCSPGFVFIQEPQPRAAAAAQGTRPLTDHELACRLSYFLWSSLPDDELLTLAAQGALKQPATLSAQVTRMLADAKSRRFVENFAGQWLDVEQFGSVEPAKEYKGYDNALKVASREEPLAFFQQVLAENLPVAVFLDSDFLVINERLAQHYGIEGVSGEAFQNVALNPEHHRGGVLGIHRGTGFGSGTIDKTLAWTRGGTPIPAENRPHILFDKLFRAESPVEVAARKVGAGRTGSVLDAVRDEAKSLQNRLGKDDLAKLEEYFNSIRDVEQSIATDLAWLDKPKPQVAPLDFGKNVQALDPELQNKTNFDYRRYQRLMFDVITLALQTDSTRVINYYARRDLNDGTYCDQYMGCPYNYHEMTHHGEDPGLTRTLGNLG